VIGRPCREKQAVSSCRERTEAADGGEPHTAISHCALSDAELPDQITQALAQLRQAAGGLGALLGFVRHIVDRDCNLVNAAVDLFGNGGLLLRCTGNLRIN